MGSGRRKRQKTTKQTTAVRSEDMDGPAYIASLIESACEDAVDDNMTRDEIMQRAQAVRHLPPCYPTATKAADAYK